MILVSKVELLQKLIPEKNRQQILSALKDVYNKYFKMIPLNVISNVLIYTYIDDIENIKIKQQQKRRAFLVNSEEV